MATPRCVSWEAAGSACGNWRDRMKGGRKGETRQTENLRNELNQPHHLVPARVRRRSNQLTSRADNNFDISSSAGWIAPVR